MDNEPHECVREILAAYLHWRMPRMSSTPQSAEQKADMGSVYCGIFDKARVLEVTSCPAVPTACCTVFRKYSN